jgi:hypothetical protein
MRYVDQMAHVGKKEMCAEFGGKFKGKRLLGEI